MVCVHANASISCVTRAYSSTNSCATASPMAPALRSQSHVVVVAPAPKLMVANASAIASAHASAYAVLNDLDTAQPPSMLGSRWSPVSLHSVNTLLYTCSGGFR